jgi:hypothetical protein
MAIDILLTIIVTATIQSVFGVGVLLFGTPALLLLGYKFNHVLIILLPISVTINLFQVIKHSRYIDKDFYKKILIYTIPFVVLFLFLVTNFSINIGIVIGLFLIFVSLKSYSIKIEQILEGLVRYERTYFIVMGIIHGLTNLGGSLLTAIVHGKNYPEKDITRVTCAVSYGTFAVFQILTLLISALVLAEFDINIQKENGIYLLAGVVIFFLTEKFVYANIDSEKYSKIFAIFLFASGILLVYKSI